MSLMLNKIFSFNSIEISRRHNDIGGIKSNKITNLCWAYGNEINRVYPLVTSIQIVLSVKCSSNSVTISYSVTHVHIEINIILHGGWVCTDFNHVNTKQHNV